MSVQITLRELLEAGAHFGHQTSRWNPKMKKYIFEARNGIHIIDLQKTLSQFKKANEFLADCVSRNLAILLVGTKKQAKEIVRNAAIKCNVHWVTERWLGGTLTNLETVRRSVRRLRAIEQMGSDGSLAQLRKKESVALQREESRLRKNLDGIQDMNRLPGVLFVVDPTREKIAIKEAQRLGIPIVALIDTNCDPDGIQYPIACNDDAIRTIHLVLSKIEQAIMDAKGMSKDQPFSVEAGVPKEEAVSKEEKV